MSRERSPPGGPLLRALSVFHLMFVQLAAVGMCIQNCALCKYLLKRTALHTGGVVNGAGCHAPMHFLPCMLQHPATNSQSFKWGLILSGFLCLSSWQLPHSQLVLRPAWLQSNAILDTMNMMLHHVARIYNLRERMRESSGMGRGLS